MPFALSDTAGLLVYILIAAFVYKKGWFFSFYSFFKFILVIILSLALSIILSSKNPYQLPITNLQLSLIIQGLTFVILWRLISFKKIFFKATDSVFSLNRFIFIHHIDKFLNIIPSFVASFFVTFFLFTVAVSASTYVPGLASQIESSKIVKPLSYEIYFATVSPSRFGLFQNVAYKLVPDFHPGDEAGNLSNATETAISSFAQRLAQQDYYIPQQPGTSPLLNAGGGQSYSPPPGPQTVYVPTPNTQVPAQETRNESNTAQQPPVYAPPSVPTATKAPLPLIHIIFPTSTPVPVYTAPPPQYQNPIPTPTPAPVQTPVVFSPAPSQNISQVEQDILSKTNQERAAVGVGPLVWSDALAAVARAHSQDMATRNFFSHINPDGLDPFQRMKIGGIIFTTAAENIAGGPSADIMMTNWMHSEGHRANILNPSLGHLGVGVSLDSEYGLVATQDFTN